MAALGLAVEKKLSLTVLRPFHIFGEGEKLSRFWPSLRAAAWAGRDFPMTAGGQVRDFVSVESVAGSILSAASKQVELGAPVIRNIGTGRPQTLRAFAEHWWKQWGAQGSLQFAALPYRVNEVMRYVPRLEDANSYELSSQYLHPDL